MRGHATLTTLLMVLVSLGAGTVPARAQEPDTGGLADLFPSPPGLESRVGFWLAVYTRYTTRQAILHDAEHPDVVYGILNLRGVPDGGVTEYPEDDVDRMDEARDRVSRVLAWLAHFRGDPASLTREERQILEAAARLPGRRPLAGAADRVRSQRGQADRFRLGLSRSGRYVEVFRRIAAEEGVPGELALLPHVESSFAAGAVSSAGAAGMWQFMPGTARRYLAIDGSRDERLDPWMSARAAFRLLRENHDALGSWPLAITAYNHGQAGMARARKRFGDDLVAIIDGYDARTFGFASKNFYAEFLATLRIADCPDVWFGTFRQQPEIRFELFALPDFTRIPALCVTLALPLDELRSLNPALRSAVWSGDRLAPRGYELRVPEGYGEMLHRDWASLPGSFRYERAVDTVWHVVRSGENLSRIARKYGTSVARLVALNGMGRRRTIFPKQRLKIRQAEQWTEVPGAGQRRHVVRKGETLTAIGLRYGVAVKDLVHSNGLTDPSRVRIGQVLVIPQVAGTP